MNKVHGNVLPHPRGDRVSTTHGSTTDRVLRRYALQAAARELLPGESVAQCMRGVVPHADGMAVGVLYAPVGSSTFFSGLQVCKSVWHCPVCAAKISERRRQELTSGLGAWPGRVLLVTMTLQHNIAESLVDVLAALTRARSLLVSGRTAKDFNGRFGVLGSIRSLELTHGQAGWHPHMHVLMFFDKEPGIIPFEQAIKERWSSAVAATGRYASWGHGCDVRFTDADIAAYIAKFGREPRWSTSHEMTKAVSKLGRQGGRTPMQLLADFVGGDTPAGALWAEYARAMKGQRQLCWSPGLRARLGLEDEQTDEQLAVEQEEIAILLASLSVGAWRVVLGNDARAELLEVANTGSTDRVHAFLAQLGVLGAAV